MKIFSLKKTNPTKLTIELIVLACVILLGVSGWLWWTRIVMNPNRVLSDAIAKNLQTRSITKKVDQTGPTGGVSETSYISFFPPTVNAQTRTVLSQGEGANSASVTTETIGTSEADFVRYVNVTGSESLTGVNKLNGLLGIWAKREQNLSKGQSLSFLNEGLFGIMPYGYFNNDQKDQLIGLINQKNVYKYTSVERQIDNKRPVYVYDLSINPVDLVTVLRQYIVLSGAGDASQLDPSQYQGVDNIKIKLTIDILSRQVTKVDYSTGRVETYSGQNLYLPLNLPGQTIPVEELQQRLNQAQSS